MVSERDLAIIAEADYTLESAKIEALRQEVLATRTVPEAQDYCDRIQYYVRRFRRHRDISHDIVHQMAALELEAQRHIGRLLLDIPRQPGGRTDLKPGTDGSNLPHTYIQTLEAAGLDRETARRYQHLAQVPETAFKMALNQAKETRRLPTRLGIIKDAQRLRRHDSVVRRVIERAVELAWPDLREAHDLAWQSLKREYGWVDTDWLDYWMPTVTAERLLVEVGLTETCTWLDGTPPGLASAIEAGELSPEQVMARVRDTAREQGITKGIDWTVVDHRVSDVSWWLAIQRGESPGAAKTIPDAPASKDPEARLNPAPSAHLNMALGILGQIDRLPLPPNMFVSFLRDAKGPDAIAEWQKRLEIGREWLEQALEALRKSCDGHP
jgi:hypothetical protein